MCTTDFFSNKNTGLDQCSCALSFHSQEIYSFSLPLVTPYCLRPKSSVQQNTIEIAETISLLYPFLVLRSLQKMSTVHVLSRRMLNSIWFKIIVLFVLVFVSMACAGAHVHTAPAVSHGINADEQGYYTNSVEAFVCTTNDNSPVRRQSLSHGHVLRICVRTRPGYNVMLEGLDSFVLSQKDGGGIQQNVVRVGGQMDQEDISNVTCEDNLCILETYLDGNFFLSRGKTFVHGHVNVTLETKYIITPFRLLQTIQTQTIPIQVSIRVKTGPLPCSVQDR